MARPHLYGLRPPRGQRGARPARRGGAASPVGRLMAAIAAAAVALAVLPVVGDASLGVLRPMRAEAGACRLVHTIDGDTADFWCAGQGAFAGLRRARLTGYDAPELFSPGCAAEMSAAMAAKWALRGMILGADSLEIGFEGRDRYGRDLAAVTLDGAPLSALMIAAGHGRAYDGGRRGGWCD